MRKIGWVVIGIIVGVVGLVLVIYIRERQQAGVGLLLYKQPPYCHDAKVRFSADPDIAPNGAFPDPFIICKDHNKVTFMVNDTEKIVSFEIQFKGKTPFRDDQGNDKFKFLSPDPLPASCIPGNQASPVRTNLAAHGPILPGFYESFEYSLDLCSVDANGNASTSHFDPGGIVMK